MKASEMKQTLVLILRLPIMRKGEQITHVYITLDNIVYAIGHNGVVRWNCELPAAYADCEVSDGVLYNDEVEATLTYTKLLDEKETKLKEISDEIYKIDHQLKYHWEEKEHHEDKHREYVIKRAQLANTRWVLKDEIKSLKNQGNLL